MVHGHNEGHIAAYNDIEFQATKYHIFHEMLWQNIITDVRNNCNTFDNDKNVKQWTSEKSISQQDTTKVV